MAADTIGARVYAARLNAGMSRLELAVAADIHPNTVQRIEKDKTLPTMPTLTAIAAALKVDAGSLLYTTARP